MNNNPIKSSLKTEILPILFLLASVILSFYFYTHFPERVVTHWGLNGEPNGWSGPAFAAFFFPGMILGIYLLMLFFPMLDPKRERYAEFSKVYHIFKNIFVFVFFLIYVITGLNALGVAIPVDKSIMLIIGLLFMIMGNYFGKIKSNWYMGIRTPWTISSEVVWNKTHRLGGKLFMLAGFMFILLIFLPVSFYAPVFVSAILLASIVPMVYSYILFRKEEKKKNNSL